jgi:orotate phosphoribosyltransferase
MVTTVPSGERERDDRHPLRWIAAEVVGATRGRHERLLRRSEVEVASREFNPEKYAAVRPLNGQSVLLIDDTWTTGANAQSAAAALKAAGAGPIAAVVIGRHLNREWHENDRRLRGISGPFDWRRCALCGL